MRGASGTARGDAHGGSDAFAVREWLAADADARAPNDPALRDGVDCDDIGCVARLADGTIVALPFAAQAFEEDCRRGRAGGQPAHRAAGMRGAARIDRTVWPRSGASALYRRGKAWQTVAAYPAGYDRPWAKAAPRQEGAARTPATSRRRRAMRRRARRISATED